MNNNNNQVTDINKRYNEILQKKKDEAVKNVHAHLRDLYVTLNKLDNDEYEHVRKFFNNNDVRLSNLAIVMVKLKNETIKNREVL